MILVVGDKHYPSVTVDSLSIRHMLALQRELVLLDVSRAKTFADVKELAEEFAAASEDERKRHPEGVFLLCLAVWAARVSAGEDVTLREVLDTMPLSQLATLRTIKEPHDRHEATGGKGQPRQSTGGKRKTSNKK